MFSYKTLYQCLDQLIYSAFLFLACYFIYVGDVLDKFRSKRTNFAEYLEPVTELPTITTYIQSTDKIGVLLYGKDFNISYAVYTGQYTDGGKSQLKYNNLTIGINKIEGSPLKVMFEIIYDFLNGREIFKITPLNFNPILSFPMHYELWYDFSKATSFTKKLKLGLQLSTENGTTVA